MVILFSNRKSKTEKEIIEILTACGADVISDKGISATGGYFTVTVLYKPTDLKIKKGIALILDDTDRFCGQALPFGVTGICEDSNSAALKIFAENSVPVITCGSNSKNTVTLSSINGKNMVISLQRTLTDGYGKKLLPCDLKVRLKKEYSAFAVMCCTVILLLEGYFPTEF